MIVQPETGVPACARTGMRPPRPGQVTGVDMEVVDPVVADTRGLAEASSATAHGDVRSTTAAPGGIGLWRSLVSVLRGASLNWQPAGDEEALYVVSGRLLLSTDAGDDGVECEAGSAIVVEAGSNAALSAADEAVLVHFGVHESSVGQPPAEPRVHFVDRRGRHRSVATRNGTSIETRSYFDSTCSGCSVGLLVGSSDGEYRGSSHHHSSPEIVHVLAGEIMIGPTAVAAGGSVAVPAHRRYRLKMTPGSVFVNYRPRASSIVHDPKVAPRDETADTLGWAATDAVVVDLACSGTGSGRGGAS
jgi:quercetin dioxygenase-like cupin family protein